MPRKRKVPNQPEVPAKTKPAAPTDGGFSADQMNVFGVIVRCQKSDANFKKCFAELNKLYGKMEHKKFMEALFRAIHAAMHREETDVHANKILKFCSSFIASFGEENSTHPIIQDAFDELLSLNSPIATVRMRICQFIMFVMNAFSVKAEIDDDIFDAIIESMLDFVKDVSPIVRIQAVNAMQRLQDPDNKDDVVVKAYLYHMELDPSPKVRQAVITAIGKKLPVIPSIMERLHDVDEKVRRHVYVQMSSFPVKQYRIAERLVFLECGLYDRSEAVKKVVTSIMLPQWVESYEKKYDQFVAAIKMDSNDEEMARFRKIAHMALLEVFKRHNMNEIIDFLQFSPENEFKNCVPFANVTLENLIVWKAIIQHFESWMDKKRPQSDEDLDVSLEHSQDVLDNGEILPELSVMCDFIEKYINEANYKKDKWEKLNFNHCVLTLLEIVRFYDLGDELGREKLKMLLKKILTEHDVGECAIKLSIELLQDLMMNVEQRLEFLHEIVRNVITANSAPEMSLVGQLDDILKNSGDIDLRLKVTELKLKIMGLVEQESSFVEQKRYTEAQKVADDVAKVNEELADLLRSLVAENTITSDSTNISKVLDTFKNKMTQDDIVKSLQIAYYSIISRGVTSLTLNLLNLYKEFIVRHQNSTDVTVRVWALKTSTACCMLYDSIAKEVYMVLKGQLFKTTVSSIWSVGIECIFELIDRYGFDFLGNEIDASRSIVNSNDRSKKGGRTLYTSNMDDEDEEEEDMTIDIMNLMFHIMDICSDNRIYKSLLIGMCRIILHGHYSTKESLTRFILLFFNPATDPEISQILGVFFENMRKNKLQEQLQAALIPSVLALIRAPPDSPLKEIKVETILKYIIGATHPVYCSPGLNLHNTIAIEFLQMMKDNVDQKEVIKLFSKDLLTLEISEDDASLKTDLLDLMDPIIKEYEESDPKVVASVISFKQKLEGKYRAPLSFSSTARGTLGVNRDPDEEEELETGENLEGNGENLEENEKFYQEDILDISVSQVLFKNLEIPLKDAMVPTIEEVSEEEENETVVEQEEHQDHVVIPLTQSNDVEVPETQEFIESFQELPSIEIPATQALTEEDEEIPPSPAAATVKNTRNKRHFQNSDSSSSSKVTSPLRKQMKTAEVPRVSKRVQEKTPSRSTRRGAVATPTTSSPARKKLDVRETPGSSRRNQKELEKSQKKAPSKDQATEKVPAKSKEVAKETKKSPERPKRGAGQEKSSTSQKEPVKNKKNQEATQRGQKTIQKQPEKPEEKKNRETAAVSNLKKTANVAKSASESTISTRNKAKVELASNKVMTRKSMNEIFSKSPTRASSRQNTSMQSPKTMRSAAGKNNKEAKETPVRSSSRQRKGK